MYIHIFFYLHLIKQIFKKKVIIYNVIYIIRVKLMILSLHSDILYKSNHHHVYIFVTENLIVIII
jgi:hypothetical protein